MLRIGAGNFDVGFPVTLQIFENGQLIKEEKDWFRIPTAPEIPQIYKNWRDKYHVLGRAIQPVEGQTTNSSILKTCQAAARELEDYMRRWFEDIHFASLRDRIRVEAQVRADESVAIILDCNTGTANQDLQLRKLPWHLWDLLSSHLPNTEVALNAGFNRPVEPLGRPVKILAIFGSSKGGLKLEEDITALKALQQRGAEITFELQPNREVLHQRLSKQAWDILFFAGHSSSEAGNRRGYLQIGDDRSLSLDDLREDLKKAVAKNLKLAVFNSCDGLGIADYLADLKVPITIAMREPVPDLVARKFLRYFLEEFSSGKPLYQAVREARSSLHWMESDDENPCPAATWLPVICQNPNQPELVWSGDQRVPWRLIGLGGAAAALLAVVVYLLIQPMPNQTHVCRSRTEQTQWAGTERVSCGDRNLLPKEDGNANQLEFRNYKAKGIQAMAEGQYYNAIVHFEKALQVYPNAPETRIYLNNARIGDAKAYTLAAVVPISGSNPNNALEMLRGFAQAQTEINDNGGINGIPLKLVIIDDADDPTIARQVATILVKAPEVLAVMGHWTSDVSLAGGAVYNAGKLVFVAPLSTTVELSNFGPYVFRTNINNYTGGQALAKHMLNTWQHKQAAIFYVQNVTYSEEIRTEFSKTVTDRGGEIVASFDLSDPQFSAYQSVEQAIRQGAKVLLLATNNASVDKALQVMQVNENRLKLLGDLANLYSPKTLEVGRENAVGMVMAVSWHIDADPTSNFPKSSKQLWKADVNYATAMSYDAAQALAEALKRNPTRTGIQQALRDQNFSAPGAADPVQFSSSGDRRTQIQLVEIQKVTRSRSGTGFDFVPLPSQDAS